MNHTTTFIAKARKLWDEGLSTSKIGLRLGVSKNVIIGIAHRNDFPARPSPIKYGVTSHAHRPRQASPTRIKVLSIAAGWRVAVDDEADALLLLTYSAVVRDKTGKASFFRHGEML